MRDRRDLIKVLTLAPLALVGCRAEPVNAPPSADGITIKDIPDDVPKFKRSYTVVISANVSMEIRIRNYSLSRTSVTGELTQKDGRWVLFDPERPADKILDREILPIVEQRCAAILALDAAFRRSPPSEFVDEGGIRWRKV